MWRKFHLIKRFFMTLDATRPEQIRENHPTDSVRASGRDFDMTDGAGPSSSPGMPTPPHPRNARIASIATVTSSLALAAIVLLILNCTGFFNSTTSTLITVSFLEAITTRLNVRQRLPPESVAGRVRRSGLVDCPRLFFEQPHRERLAIDQDATA